MMIYINKLNKKYKNGSEELHVLKDLSLEIAEGDFVSILGKSGSGKSTLLKIVGLIDNSFGGEYRLNGEPIMNENDNQLTKLRNLNIGFVFQDFQLIEDLNAYQNLELVLSMQAHVKKHEQKQMIIDTLEKVGLGDKLKNFPNQLSGGQQQRLSIARALVKNPKIIIADEPTGALDEQTAKEIVDLIIKLNNQGSTIIIVTHDNDVAQIAKSQYFLKSGVLDRVN